MTEQVRPIKQGVLIRPVVAITQEGGLHIPQVYQEPEPEGEVLAVGPDVQEVRPGDYVRYERYNEKWVHQNGERLAIVEEGRIWGIMDPSMKITDDPYAR